MDGRKHRAVASVLGLLACALPASSQAQTDGYILGQGVNAGPFNIAGYATIEAEAKKGEDAGLLIDDLSLFVKGSVNSMINPFLELEIAEADLWFEGDPPLKDPDPRLDIERLYNDFIFGEHATVRAGKMLAPVGEWNLIHAGPLVWTTTRPLTTYRNFPEFVTGVSFISENIGENQLRLEGYWQPAGDLDPPPADALYRFENTMGFQAELPLGLTDKIGLSIQHADLKRTQESQLLIGLNGRFTFDRLELETEMSWTSIANPLPGRVRDSEFGGYIQGAYEVFTNWFAVGRAEVFKDRNVQKTSRNFVFGVNYRPNPAIAWKLEYVEQSGADLGISSGVIASFNVLF